MLAPFSWLPHQPLSQAPGAMASMPGSSQIPSQPQPLGFFPQHALQPQHAQHAQHEAPQHAQRILEISQPAQQTEPMQLSSDQAQRAQHGSDRPQHAQQAAESTHHADGLAERGSSGGAQQADASQAQTDSGYASAADDLRGKSSNLASAPMAEQRQDPELLPVSGPPMELSSATLVQHAKQMYERDLHSTSDTALPLPEQPQLEQSQQDQSAQPEFSFGSLLASEQLSGGGKSQRGNGKGGAGKASSGLPKRQMNFWQEEEKVAFMNAYKVSFAWPAKLSRHVLNNAHERLMAQWSGYCCIACTTMPGACSNAKLTQKPRPSW